MIQNYDHNQHSVYLLYYHLIMVVKYRRKVIRNEISDRGRKIFTKISYKSASSRLLKKEFPKIRQKLWKEAFWSKSYMLLTTGEAPAEVSRPYIESQREQRTLSHCEKGSCNYRKQRRKVAKVHEKVRQQRKDFLHKLSRKLADACDVVGVEDIDMKTMSRSLHFGKSVMDNGYGMLRSMLEYKLAERGGELVKVDRWFPSSKRCSCCGKIKEELALDERMYVCSCGNVMDRDVNAAVNIKQEAMRFRAS